MQLTHKLSDKLILFILCTLIYLGQPSFEAYVVPLIIAIIISSLISYIDQTVYRYVLEGFFILLCFLIPELILYIPLLVYDLVDEKYPFLIAVFLLPIYIKLDLIGIFLALVTIGVMLMSIWLRRRTTNWIKLNISHTNLQDDTRELTRKFKEQNQELLEISESEIHMATLKERNRIAREIHDNVGHQLSRAILQMGALITLQKNEADKEGLVAVNETLTQAMSSIRESVHDLHDQSVDLNLYIQELLKHFTCCQSTFENDIKTEPDKTLKVTFIAIIKEALSNIMKHSDATQVFIYLREHPAFYQLIIRDNGHVKVARTDGMGLMNMADRVQALKGNINIQKNNGFEIFISIPKGEEE